MGWVYGGYHRSNADEESVRYRRYYTVGTQHYICAFNIPPNVLAGVHGIPSKLAACIL